MLPKQPSAELGPTGSATADTAAPPGSTKVTDAGAPDSEAPTVRQDPSYADPRSERHVPVSARQPAIRLPVAGDTIGGSYRVVGELGRGAMGVVLSAIDEQLQRKVAIKLIRAELLKPGFRERFMQEARAMARVNHPNVLCIHAFGEHEAIPYFVMELVEGMTLEGFMAESSSPPDLDTGLRILNDVCTGVSAIHAAGTVHRDIKPSNILLDTELRARVADFGVSTAYQGAGPAPSEIVGTPAYMAPEIAFASGSPTAPTPRADVYSLACVAYELLTGRMPFEVEGELALMVHHATAPVPAPSSFRADLPATFDQVLLQALAKKPEERTATVELLRRGLMEARDESLEPVRILVAEDDDDFREVLEFKLRLEFPDADIECVADGRAALDALEKRLASVAILDLRMPVVDGVTVTALLREREESRGMPIIVLTASGGPEEWKRLSMLGADRFLVKPVNLDDVVTLIRSSIRERTSLLPRSKSGA